MSPSHWKAYQETKNSGIEWLGRVPAHWSSRRLKHAVLLECEKALPDADTPYVGLENVESWTGRHVDTEAEIDGVGNVFRPGDVLFGKLRPYLAKALLAGESGQCSSEFLVLRPVALSGRFLVDLVRSRGFVDTVDAQTYGTKMPRADWDTVADMRVPLPPREEQDAIADLLDRETAKIDALVEKKGRLIGLLQEKRTALITHAVTKGLDPNVPMKDPGIEWLGQIPAHWDELELKFSLAQPITDGPHETPEFLDEGIPFLSAEAVKNDRLDFEKKRGFISQDDHLRFSRKYTPRKGDVYVVKSGATTGNVARVETDEVFDIWSPLAAARPRHSRLTTDFLFFFLKSEVCRKSIELSWSFGTQQNIGMGVLSNLRMILPPLEEQQAIANFLARETAKIDSLIGKVQEAIERLKEYRTALISAAVTGKIDVRS